MARKDPQLNIRIPPEILDLLRKVAEENHRSVRGQVLFCLERCLQEAKKKN